ncbi:hypothetical protein GIX45_10400 [Erwinia sp. CPCC 100877]|nr:hypothetical protein [Erwinia sp. CPCC 100877]
MSATNRTLEVKIENGLGFSSIPGMTAINSGTDWQFDASTLPTQLQGVIVNATYVPNESVSGGYQPKAGKVIYSFNSGTTSVNLSLGIKTDRPLNVAFSDLTINDSISVTSKENEAVIRQEKLESYIMTGPVYPVLYSSGLPQSLTLKSGESGTLSKVYRERNDIVPLIPVDAVVEKIEYVFKVDKSAGIKDVNYVADPSSMTVVIDRDMDETYDYVFATIESLYLNRNVGPTINFVYEVPDETPDGSYYLTTESAKNTANGKEFDDQSSYTAERQVINVKSVSNVKISDVSNNYFNYDSMVSDTNMTSLGGFSLSNIGMESDEQKVRLTFDDENIGVRAVSLAHEKGGAATDIIVKTNKGQTLTATSLNGSAMSSAYAFSRYNLLLSSLGTVADDEYITEITYNMGKIAAGASSFTQYRGSQNMKTSDTYALPIGYHGYLLKMPASKTYSASATIVDADKEFEDEQALSATNTMNIVAPEYVTFNAGTNIDGNTQFLSGTTHTIWAALNITGYPYTSTSPSVVKGFDVYLRGGEYLRINVDTIAISYEGKTYSVSDGTLVATPGVDNAGYPLYKIELPDVILGQGKGDSFFTFSAINVSYDVKVKPDAPTTYIPGNDLIQIFAKNLKTTTVNGGNSMYNTPDIYDVNGNGDTSEYAGNLDISVGVQLIEQKDFSVTTAVNLNNGPWVSYDYKTNTDIINLNPSGETKYQLSISNNSGATINGYTALIPIPKAGGKTDLTPSTVTEFNASEHLQKTAFEWTASLLEEIVPSGNLNYEILYATSYETNKDSANFKSWNEISKKDDIRMIKVVTTGNIPTDFSESITFPLALTDPQADLNAGKTNIYSARIYREVLETASYTTSEPIAIRLQTGVVKGQVFNDTNRNGLKESSETGLNGVTVLAYKAGSNRTELLESTLTKTIDGKEGSYEFLGLAKTQNVDVVFVNPSTDDSLRFSPATAGGSTPTADSNHLRAQTSGLTPSGTGFDAVDAGFVRPITINFDAKEGSTAQSTVKKYPGETIATEPQAELIGTTFMGWYTQATGGTKVTFPYNVGTSDVTLYARYAANSYKVTYNVEGATEEITVDYDSLLT